jgi:CubicO group peptidase (beta-lactamase class C family)
VKIGVRALIPCALLVVSTAWAAPDEELLGKAEGYPVCKLPPADKCLVGTLSHFDEVVPARKVAKGPAVRPLKPAGKPPALSYDYEGKAGNVDSFLERNRNTGLLVLHGDTVLAERYQYDRRPEHRFQSYSMAKTVVALLVGIALEEKRIGSLDDLVQKYVPELKGHPYGETSLRHLLTMSSGMNVGDQSPAAVPMFNATVLRQGAGGPSAVLHLKERAIPAGTKFLYSSTDTEVLSLALRGAVGKPLADYLSEKIWQPMGAEADATWNIDAGGYELGYMGINATLRDWARLGALMANDGAIDGKQLVPAAWVRTMTTPESERMKPGALGRNMGYGYQTWLLQPAAERSFRLWGVRGQGVYVDPASKLVIVHTAVTAQPGDPVPEQYFLFRGVLNSVKAL